MAAFTKAVYARLTGDTTLKGLLSTWKTKPAIFSDDPAPEDAAIPFVVISGPIADSADDSKTDLGRRHMRDIRCYAADTAAVEQIAERVRVLFHRQTLTIDGHRHMMTLCSGPTTAPYEADSRGMIVTIDITATEEV